MAILAGLMAVFAGIWGMIHWAADFTVVLKGLIPVSLVFAGLVAVIVGVSAKSASPSNKKSNEKS